MRIKHGKTPHQNPAIKLRKLTQKISTICSIHIDHYARQYIKSKSHVKTEIMLKRNRHNRPSPFPKIFTEIAHQTMGVRSPKIQGNRAALSGIHPETKGATTGPKITLS